MSKGYYTTVKTTDSGATKVEVSNTYDRMYRRESITIGVYGDQVRIEGEKTIDRTYILLDPEHIDVLIEALQAAKAKATDSPEWRRAA